MAQISFKIGNAAQLGSLAVKDGQFIVVEDQHCIFVDKGEKRIRIGDFQTVDSVDSLPASAPETALYYIADINVLAKYKASGDPGTPEADAGQWIQINLDTGATGVEVDGAGKDAITATYEKSDRKIKITVGEKLITETALGDKIGNIDESENVAAYVDKKTQGISGNYTQLNAKVEALEGKVGDAEGPGLVKDVTDLKAKVDTKQDKITFEGEYNASSNKAATMNDVKSAIAGLSGAMHFKGVVDQDPDTLENKDTYATGDVVAFGNKEYVFMKPGPSKEEEGKFVELGDTTDISGRVSTIESWKGTMETWKGTTDETLGSLESTYATKVESNKVKTDLIGLEADTEDMDTIHGAKKYADEAIKKLNIDDYVQDEELTSKLATYATTESLSAYVKEDSLTSKLEPYAKTEQLDGYLKTEDLPEQLTDYAKTEALASYAQKTELESYAKAVDLEWGTF